MKSINEIHGNFRENMIFLSDHAQTRAIERKIYYYEMIEAGIDSIIIEDYPNDKYSHSCLILGYTKNKRPLHIQITRNDSNKIKIITVYEPNKDEWINYIERIK